MMLVLCKLQGAGTQAAPHRVNFPTFHLIALDPVSGLAIADVRNEDVPAGLPVTPFNAAWVPAGPVNVVKYVAAQRATWNALVQKRYPQGFSAWDSAVAVSP